MPESGCPGGIQRSLALAVIGLMSWAPLAFAAKAAPAAQAPAVGVDPSQPPRSCPALLPANEHFLEPMRLAPREVPAKNARGCLSPSDAIYGPDGCPTKLCPQPKGVGL